MGNKGEAQTCRHRSALGCEDRLRRLAWGLAVLASRGQATSRAIGRAMAAVSEGKLDWLDPERRC